MAQQPQQKIEPGVLAPGQIFEDKFEIIEVLGQGGMGVVYKARHTHMNKLVALKTMMLSVVSDDEESFRRFVQEAQAASSLDHANIVRILDFAKTSNGMAYLVMEYLGSVSLEDLLSNQANLDVDHFLRIAVQICEGLHHAHRKNIVHRDIKPSNIMLAQDTDAREIVKIVDFGMAKLTAVDNQQHLTKTGTIVGTPLFMSPEQCRGLELDHRSDIYSLGCVMYTMLTGRVPFRGNSALDTLYKHATEAPPHFAAVNPQINVPPRLEQAILKALQKEPSNRQTSMIELRNEITDAIFYRSYNTGSVDFPAEPISASEPLQGAQGLSKTLDISHSALGPPETKVPSSDANTPKKESARARPETKLSKSSDSGEKNLTISHKTAQAIGFGAVIAVIAGAALLTSYRPAASPADAGAKAPPPVAKQTVEAKQAVVASTAQRAAPGQASQTPAKSASLAAPTENKSIEGKKAAPPIKIASVLPRKQPGVSSKSASGNDRSLLLKQAHSFAGEGHNQMRQHNFGAAEIAFANSIRFQSKVFGASDSRIFPDLAHMVACELAQKKDLEVKRNLLWALQIFNSKGEQVHSLVAKLPDPQGVWWPLARASHQVAEESQGAARSDYLKWSKGFYELTRTQTGSLPPTAVAAIDKQYTNLLTEISQADQANKPPQKVAAPAKAAGHSHTERHGRLRIWTR